MQDDVTTIVVLDTETTDMDPDNGAELCEIGWVTLHKDTTGRWSFGPGYSTLLETNAVFSPAARAAHHLHPNECKPGAPNCLPRSLVIHEMLVAEELGTTVYAAHNAPFDMKFLPELTLPVIDTYVVAKHLWPDSPKFSNQTLRYYLEAEAPPDLLEGLAPHRALYDAAVTAAVLVRALELFPPMELVRLSTTPILQAKCTFGKHKDLPWAEVPMDYLHWMVRSNDMYRNDPDIKYTVDHYLNNRVNQLHI
jgi:exodeoxyribonuclease X